VLIFGLSAASHGEFTFEDDGVKTLTLLENGQQVLCYNYGRMEPPEGSRADPERYWRSSYIHPLYGLDGEVMTQDFPSDHFHHRGLYWTWPECKAGERAMDIWAIVGVRQLFQEWLKKEAGADCAEFVVRNAWQFDDDPEPKVEERVHIYVHPADTQGRCIDLELTFTNVCQDRVIIRGQLTPDSVTKKAKGYGGFCLRPDATRKPMTFTTSQGIEKQDVLELDTPWADVSFHTLPDAKGPLSGVAIFQNPKNPGYPHPGWIFRHYGFLGASWPHSEPHLLKPGEAVTLRYRVYVHRGSAQEASVGQVFDAYLKATE